MCLLDLKQQTKMPNNVNLKQFGKNSHSYQNLLRTSPFSDISFKPSLNLIHPIFFHFNHCKNIP